MALLTVGASPRLFTDFALHDHGCFEIIMDTEGEGIYRIGEKTYPFAPGTVHIIPPNTPHRKTAANGFRDIYLHTDSLAPHGAYGAFVSTEPIVLTDDTSHTMENLFLILLSRYAASNGRDIVTETLFDAVLELIAERATVMPSDPIIDSVLHLIKTSYSDPEFQITNALLSTGYSKDHLRRRFVAAVGMTPGQYLQAVRIRHAKQLLTEKRYLRLSVAEIAALCGYYDPAYFCRVFQKATGMTPLIYANR